MCKKCEKLKIELEEQIKHTKANYEAYQELKSKFEKLAVSFCYLTDVGNPLE